MTQENTENETIITNVSLSTGNGSIGLREGDLEDGEGIASIRSCEGLACTPFIVLEIVALIVTVVGNSLFIVAFLKSKDLRRKSNYAVFSLAITDLITGIFGVPYNIVASYLVGNVPALDYLRTEKYFCLVKINLGVVLLSISYYHHVLIALERYVKICRRSHYDRLISSKRLTSAIVFMWLYSSGITLLPLLGWNSWTPGKECRGNKVELDFMRYLVVPPIPISIFLATVFYVAIYRHVRRSRRQIENHYSSHEVGAGGENAPDTPNQPRGGSQFPGHQAGGISGSGSGTGTGRRINESGSSQTRVTSLGSVPVQDTHQRFLRAPSLALTARLSVPTLTPMTVVNQNGQVGDIKIAKIFAIIICSFTLLYTPYCVLIILENRLSTHYQTFLILYNISIGLAVTSSAVNPIIYGLFNKNVRKMYSNLLKCS